MKTFNISDDTHKQLKALCKVHGESMVNYIGHAVRYFKQTGINPEYFEKETPQKAVKELSKRVEQIIGVIKAQEQDKMNPLLETLMMLVRRAEMMLNDAPKESTFKTVLSRMEEMMEADQKQHIEQLKTQHKYYKEQSERLEKSYGQTSAEVLKKMNEVMVNVDNMTVLLKSVLGKK